MQARNQLLGQIALSSFSAGLGCSFLWDWGARRTANGRKGRQIGIYGCRYTHTLSAGAETLQAHPLHQRLGFESLTHSGPPYPFLQNNNNDNDEYLERLTRTPPKRLHVLYKYKFVKIQCMQHECTQSRTHTQTRTRTHARARS